MNTQMINQETTIYDNVVYHYSRCVIRNYGQVYWHKIILDYLNEWTDLDLNLRLEDELFLELMKLTRTYTGISIPEIISEFDAYMKNLPAGAIQKH